MGRLIVQQCHLEQCEHVGLSGRCDHDRGHDDGGGGVDVYDRHQH